MTEHNTRMKNWLAANGIQATPKYIKDGSMRGTWMLYGGRCGDGLWWGNKELQDKLTSLGFSDYDGKPIGDYCGNGGDFSVFLTLTDKYTEMQLLYGTDDMSAIY